MSTELIKKVEEINALLRSYGQAAVQEIKMMKDGQVIGQIRYGFKPQYVFDAVNNVLLPENWRYEVVSKEIFDTQAVVEVQLFIRADDEWLCKGSQTGQMQIVKKNVGDAYKGAITDALQKCFSLLSIGSDAYRGLLRDVYLGKTVNVPAAKERKPQPQADPLHQKFEPTEQPTNNKLARDTELPMIDGIEYQHENGTVVAVGKAYEKRNLLKSAGFKWDKSGKRWYREVNASTAVQ